MKQKTWILRDLAPELNHILTERGYGFAEIVEGEKWTSLRLNIMDERINLLSSHADPPKLSLARMEVGGARHEALINAINQGRVTRYEGEVGDTSEVQPSDSVSYVGRSIGHGNEFEGVNDRALDLTDVGDSEAPVVHNGGSESLLQRPYGCPLSDA